MVTAWRGPLCLPSAACAVCAACLKRTLPSQIQMGRLGKNGFALLMPHCKESSALIDIARSVEARLRRAVTLNTSREAARIKTDSTLWVADIGVGVLMV